MSTEPLAREVPAERRQATLQSLLSLVQAKRKGPRAVPSSRPTPAAKAPAPIAKPTPPIAVVAAAPIATAPLSGDRRAKLTSCWRAC